MNSQMERQLSGFQPSDHLCLVYETREEQLAVMLPFIREGLAAGERCVYIVDELRKFLQHPKLAQRRRTGNGPPVNGQPGNGHLADNHAAAGASARGRMIYP